MVKKHIIKSLIPIYQPYKSKNQKKYVLDCLNTNWISSKGDYISRFEKEICKIIGTNHCITTFNGSVSLMLILKALGIGYGDEVIVPSLTYAATISSINLVGATAVLADSDDNFQLNIKDLPTLLTKKTKALMVPQLYGDAPDMSQIVSFCTKTGIYLIEDSAEVFGCMDNEKSLGSFGIASSFSFFANKSITTGEGGCVCTNDDILASELSLLKSQSHIGNFIHKGPGFNFRMTNIQAAIGLAQLEDIDHINIEKQHIAEIYRKGFKGSKISIITPKISFSAEWMPLFTLPDNITYGKFQSEMQKLNIDTRPVFTPIHLMKGFDIKTPVDLSNSERIYSKGFNLPCYPDITKDQLAYIIESVLKVVS